MTPEQAIQAITRWAEARADVEAVALVGSWARGAARPDSDVDVVILCTDPSAYLSHDSWMADFGEVDQVVAEDWGAVGAWRVFYQGGLEVEFGFTTAAWARTDPVDRGTRRVARDGLKALVDKHGLLRALSDSLSKG
jgi:hypothetical protein